jgi:DNA-directed RNA polymerase subunit RPC12/RpoP
MPGEGTPDGARSCRPNRLLTFALCASLVSLSQECFKCLECKKVVGLTAVAMIKGDLYCKNCFMRIFTKEGKYSSFGEKTLPKGAEATGNGASGDRARASTTDVPSSTSAGASAGERRGSVVLPCVVADCKNPRVVRKSYCLEHLNSQSESANGSSASSDLFDAIASKNVDKVRDILSRESTTAVAFRPNAKGVTPLEAAFTGIQNSRACGEAITQWLQKKVEALEGKANGASE